MLWSNNTFPVIFSNWNQYSNSPAPLNRQSHLKLIPYSTVPSRINQISSISDSKVNIWYSNQLNKLLISFLDHIDLFQSFILVAYLSFSHQYIRVPT